MYLRNTYHKLIGMCKRILKMDKIYIFQWQIDGFDYFCFIFRTMDKIISQYQTCLWINQLFHFVHTCPHIDTVLYISVLLLNTCIVHCNLFCTNTSIVLNRMQLLEDLSNVVPNSCLCFFSNPINLVKARLEIAHAADPIQIQPDVYLKKVKSSRF